MQEFRTEIENEIIDDEQDPLLMSAAVAAGKNRVVNGYDVKEVSQELDFINLMTWVFFLEKLIFKIILIWIFL